MDAWRVPGLALAVIKDDHVVFAGGCGVRELGRPGAVEAHTVFAIGSASKAFTAASVRMLADTGRLGLDDAGVRGSVRR